MIKGVKKLLKGQLAKRIPVKVPYVNGNLMTDKIALITGASEGIGYGIAEAFIMQGCKVIITGRNEEKLKNATNKLGTNCIQYVVWDASDVTSIDKNLKLIIDKYSRIDILVNNAGYHGNQKFGTITEADFDNTFNVNVKYVFLLSQAVSQYMISNKIEGNILNIASASSIKPAWSPYEISKWAVRGFTKGLARELAPYNIVVNGIAPGPAATSMSHWHEGESIEWTDQLPSRRLAMPIEIGNLAVFLCSDLGRNIMGDTVFCDGGSGNISMIK